MLGNTVRKGLSALVSTMPHTTVYAAEHALPVAVARMQADFEFSTCRYRLLLVYGFIQTRSRYKPQALHLGADPQRLTFLRPRWGLGSQPPTCPRVAGALHGMSWPWRCRCSRALPAASSLRAVADGEKAAGDESCKVVKATWSDRLHVSRQDLFTCALLVPCSSSYLAALAALYVFVRI